MLLIEYERLKQKQRAHTVSELDILTSKSNGLPSFGFTYQTLFLKNLYASKQFSFKRNSRSYSRYDSFLNEEGMMHHSRGDSGIIQECKTNESFFEEESATTSSEEAKQCIFRPSPTRRRINLLLIAAGLNEYTAPGLMVEEADDDDLSVDIIQQSISK